MNRKLKMIKLESSNIGSQIKLYVARKRGAYENESSESALDVLLLVRINLGGNGLQDCGVVLVRNDSRADSHEKRS